MKSPRQKYQKRKTVYKKLLDKQRKKVSLISNLRLLDVITAIAGSIFFHRVHNNHALWGTVVICTLIFLCLAIIHSKVIRHENNLAALYHINGISIMRVDGEWKTFDDAGEEFQDENHPFSKDLDIFGKASLFQWINTTQTVIGRKMLKTVLTKPYSNIDQIKLRQEAVNELSKKFWWRQRFELEAVTALGRAADNSDEKLFDWANQTIKLYNSRWWTIGIRTAPIITISMFILSYILHLVPGIIFNLLAIGQFGILFLKGNERNRTLETVYKYKNSIKLYAGMIKRIEQSTFTSPYLKQLQQELLDPNGHKASQQIRELETIVESILNRRNLLFLPINVLLLWDYQCMIALEKWKAKSGKFIQKWVTVIGDIEALSSLAVIKHDHPDWVFPDLTENHSVFKAKSMGHPLLTSGTVHNNLTIKRPVQALLITGSNMSGKSTLLRTVGINLVLAYAGAPVCASYLKCSIMKVYTCMRVNDNLEKRISSFYAELLRIKEIIESASNGKQVFFLLDEIFKGTNSHDRHTGAKAVIKKLCENGAIGMISTHDLELGELEKESGGIVKNYHFREYYRDSQIEFDYKLKPGVSPTKNALYLMKMVGIDVNDKKELTSS